MTSLPRALVEIAGREYEAQGYVTKVVKAHAKDVGNNGRYLGVVRENPDRYQITPGVVGIDRIGDEKCEGCGKPLGVVEAGRWSVCFDCTKARARSVGARGKCVCGSKRKPGAELAPFGKRGRRWIPCKRCLGTIKQTG